MSREQELRKKWEKQAHNSYSDLINSQSQSNSGSRNRWKRGNFPNVPDRFKIGINDNTPVNNMLSYEARINAENQRLGISKKHASLPPGLDKSAPPKTGRERYHPQFSYGRKEGKAYKAKEA